MRTRIAESGAKRGACFNYATLHRVAYMETSTLKFRSKVDGWLVLVIITTAIFCIGTALATAGTASLLSMLVVSLIVLLGVLFPVWLLRSTYYLLREHDLQVRSGPFRWSIPLQEIREVSSTRSPLASPALSLDRLRIDYGRDRSIMLSPEDRLTFTARLEERRRHCPQRPHQR